METIVETKNLRVEYRGQAAGQGRKVAVNQLNLKVGAGEVFGFLGPNGAGKTTTMNVLLGFVNATAGEAFLFGVNVREPIARQRIGYLPELTYYYKFLTAEELLRFYARIFGIPRRQADQRIDQLLKLVELDGARKRPIKTYSKGMQQRVGLAQALINNPDLLILDEPTSGLDTGGQAQLFALAGAEVRRFIEPGALLRERADDLEAERLRELAQLGERGIELKVAHLGQLHGRHDGALRFLGCFLRHGGWSLSAKPSRAGRAQLGPL